jgi:hypothetical protein
MEVMASDTNATKTMTNDKRVATEISRKVRMGQYAIFARVPRT